MISGKLSDTYELADSRIWISAYRHILGVFEI